MGGRVELGVDGSGEEVCVCGERERERGGGSRIPNQLPSSRFPMTSFHPSLRSCTASPLTSPLPHPLFATNTHTAAHTHTHTSGYKGRMPLVGFWHPDNDAGQLRERAPHRLETGHPTPPQTHTRARARTHTHVLQRDYPVIKSLKPQYDWSLSN